MKQLGLVRAGSRRERSALTKSEARKFINQLIAHPRIRQKASELRPHEDISGYVIDHDLSPCQVVCQSERMRLFRFSISRRSVVFQKRYLRTCMGGQIWALKHKDA